MPGSSRHVFVTGTDTGVGKTHVAARLIESLRARGVRATGFKPILSGEDRRDAEILAAASGLENEHLDEINPVWLKHPAAPLSAKLAGEAEAGNIDHCRILDSFEALATRFESVVIEGAGGWEVPITETQSFPDLAREFAAPVVVVAANRLGVLNHTKLTVDAIRRTGLEVAGVLLNEISPPDSTDVARGTNLEVLRLLLPGLPVEPVAWEESGPFSIELMQMLQLD
jgi:dethiobiotin synthetase